MTDLAHMKNSSRPHKKIQRVGRGRGSKRGASSGRGGKGDSARQGYRKRFGYEGGQVPLYRKSPVRGFTRGRFIKLSVAIALSTINDYYKDGESVTLSTLREKKLIPRRVPGGYKVLAVGELTKKVTIEASSFSEAALKKIQDQKISYTIVK